MFIFYEYLKLSAVSLLSELNFYACAHPVVGLQCFDAVGFWYWLIQIVPEKRPLNGCVCVCAHPFVRNDSFSVPQIKLQGYGD